MESFKYVRCQINCQKGRRIEAEFPAEDRVYEQEDMRLSVAEHPAGKGVRYGTIRLNLKNESCRENKNLAMEKPVRLYLEVMEKPQKITAMYMFSEWWSRPAFVESFADIPPRTQVAYLKYSDSYACLVPAVGRDFKTTMEKGTGTELCLEMSAGSGGQKDVEEPLYVLAEGATLAEAVHRAFAWLAEYKGIKTREKRRLPDMFRYLGWCSWDAFYRDITEEKVRQKADELIAKKVPVRWMLMDDGWFAVEDEKICDYLPDPEKFPDGFGQMICEIKEKSKIRWFGVWHALGGFWGGVSPESGLVETERDYLYHTVNGKIVPSPVTGEGFYRDWYEKLRAEGIDFVKVDGQSALAYYIENDFSIGSAAKGIHQALEGGALYMDGSIINCMGMAMENVLSRPNSAINRNSDDFFPKREGSFAEHLLQNAYNAVYQDELYYCDWDMFWTEHEAAKKHSLLRAVSGGPVYFSDRIGSTDPEILRPLTYLDGRILMMDRSAKPTEDCMFLNPMKDGVLKLQNTAPWGGTQAGGGIAVYNLTGREQPYLIAPTDIVGVEQADKYWVYDYFHARAFTLNRQGRYDCVLEKEGFGWFVLLPKIARAAFLGLLDKYVGFTAVESIIEAGDITNAVISESGTVGWLAEQEPQKVLVNGVDVTEQVERQDFLYKIVLPESAVKMVVSVIW
jgi:hypothetical protein